MSEEKVVTVELAYCRVFIDVGGQIIMLSVNLMLIYTIIRLLLIF